ncbi:MAG: alpha/beta hydrolase [Clostridium sp.]|uniref:alpha/beta hydrolase n=1 Tax=Clostridium sp. DSM 8431 TaxID=1761781 RepID=UPI0008E06A52|nr:alpha/beta fold hydrolase [Clostridium sp. DSM 8431]MCR4944106.1 alpha/beta hydrolase [Clostridium sp.]SFU58861.1 Pimeloyl-ACP methyl ester carboxylesterase [Clostridium sp. DSM 8431]
MNLIPESNGLKKVNMKEKADARQWVKNIAIIIAAIFLIGFLIQSISDFFGNDKISSSLYYAKVDNKKMEYKFSGTGDYTVVFDGAIGTNLNEWNAVINGLKDKGIDVKTFVYNRRGYGFSDAPSGESTEKQAENLKILLRKAGVSGKLILVGEEYGSLVLTDFARLYPESVEGMVLINPYSEDTIKSSEFRHNIKFDYLKSKIEKTGTKFALTKLIDKLNLDYHVEEFEKSLTPDELKEFNILKDQSAYRKAINNELENLYSYSASNQSAGMLKGKPLYIITNNEDNPIKNIGSEDLTTVYLTKSEDTVISVTDPSSIVSGISNVVKSAKKISKNDINN